MLIREQVSIPVIYGCRYSYGKSTSGYLFRLSLITNATVVVNQVLIKAVKPPFLELNHGLG